MFAGNTSQPLSAAQSGRQRKKSASKQQPMIIIHPGKMQNQGAIKIKKDDLKLLQQYCEQNELGIIEMPQNTMHKKQITHQKTKSEGTTPLAGNYMKSQFQVKSQMHPQMNIGMMNQSQIQQNPVLDYQKFLEEEKLYQNQKPKSSLGYYSQGHTPINSTVRITPGPQSKSPELLQYKNYHHKSQKQHPYAPQMPIGGIGQPNISQSALSSYSNIQNLIQQNSNRGLPTGQRSISRKKTAVPQNLNYNPSATNYPTLNYNSSNPQSMQSLLNQHHQHQNSKAQTSLLQKQNDDQYSLEGFSKDQLNESSYFLYEEPLNRSSHQQLQIITKNKSMMNQYPLHDESYFDATLYDQFIAGPHNISQYQTSNQKQIVDDMNSYMHQQNYVSQRPVSQNTMIQKAGTGKFIRQTPSQKISTRTATAQMNNSQSRKTQRTANNTMQNSFNSSGQNKAHDRRLLMGRTPSPNFLKRIAGIMNIGSDFLQQHMYKNSSTNKNLISSGAHSKRSQSKQQFSSNQNQPTSQNFMMGTNQINIEKTIKQKFQQKPNAQNQQQFIMNNNAHRYKSGSVTTGHNTAQNSPKRQNTPLQRGMKQQKQQQQQQQQKQPQIIQNEFASLQDHMMHQAQQQALIQKQQQNKLKIINDIEEKKALALVQGFKQQDYNSTPQQMQQQKPMMHIQTVQQNNFIQSQQQFYQPAKMIGEIMEEDPQPLSSHEFINEEVDTKSIHSDQQLKKQQQSQQQLILKQKTQNSIKSNSNTPLNQILDGGTGSNGMNNNLLLSKNSSEGTTFQQKSQGVNQNNMQQNSQNQMQQIKSQDGNQIQQYLDQLSNLRQSQKNFQTQQQQITSANVQQPEIKKSSSKQQLQQQNIRQSMEINNRINTSNSTNIVNYQSRIRQDFNQRKASDEVELITPPQPNQQSLSNLQMQQIIYDKGQNQSQDTVKTRKKTQSMDPPPKITTPSVDMFKESLGGEIEEKLREATNFQKKKQNNIINFSEKTPFEKELDIMANEIKKKKTNNGGSGVGNLSGQSNSVVGLTEEQIKFIQYQKDSMSILKQLQESGNITESLINSDIRPQQPKKSSLEVKTKQSKPGEIQPQNNRLQIQIGDNKSESYQFKKPDSKQINEKLVSPIDIQEESKSIVVQKEEIEEQILLTQEEERQIKEVVSDINEKAFYGKVLKRTKEIECDEELGKLSARSREIATVMRLIKKAFDEKQEPPVTTTDFYRIGKMLGRGAFGKVNLAMHKLIRKLVAIKSLNKECLTDEAQKNKLMKEVSLLLKLRHNHVVKIYETIETEKHIIIVMELCAGGDLLNYVRKRRRLKEPYAKVIFKQIIDGLCYIHSKYIAHRDIKLDNILLDGKGNVKIADFGVSKQCQKGQKMTEQCGTPAYIAPEILKDRGYTFSVDIWSAGVVLFAMLYGTVPFKANNMEELHKLITKGKYILKDDISIEARNLLRGLLEVNPEKRLTIKQIYRHKWFQDLDPSLELFNDQEREMIKKEYTYNDPRRYNRNENEEPVDCFTEHHLESVYNSLKNATSKSIILAPFNSTQSEGEMENNIRDSVQKLIVEKMMVLNFARRCREIDRQYEFNNNGDLDNGVYHKYINNSEENDDSGDERNQEENKELLNVPMLMSTKVIPTKKRGGRASVENSFENESSINKAQERQLVAKKIKEASQLQKEIQRRNKKQINNELDNELVETYETFQSKYSSSKLDDEKIQKIVSFGYPYPYVIKSLEDNEPNYCTAGYYLLGMDQNYC